MTAVSELIARTGRWLCELYALDLDIAPEGFVISPAHAQRILKGDGPRTGLLILEQDDQLDLGLYIDPRDEHDQGAIVEETSHLMCVAWHAAHDRPVSGLILELQGEIDRFVLARLWDGDPFAHFESFRWAAWLDETTVGRYEVAHRRAHRYCRALARRFPDRADTPGLISELRSFYRASLEAKLRIAA